MNKCRSKEARENRQSRRKRIQEEKITREIYGKIAVQMEQWEV